MSFSNNYFAVLDGINDEVSETSDASSDDSLYFDATSEFSATTSGTFEHTNPPITGPCSICETYLNKISEMNDVIAQLEHKLEFGEAVHIQPAPRPRCGLCQTFIMRIVGMNGIISGLERKLAASRAVAEEAVVQLGEVLAYQEKWLKGYRLGVERQHRGLGKRITELDDLKRRMEGLNPGAARGSESLNTNYFDILKVVEPDTGNKSFRDVNTNSGITPSTTAITPGTTPDTTEQADPLGFSPQLPTCNVCKPLVLQIEKMKWVSEPLIQKIEKMTRTIAELETKLSHKEKTTAIRNDPPEIDPSPLIQKIEDMADVIAELEKKLTLKEKAMAVDPSERIEPPVPDPLPLLCTTCEARLQQIEELYEGNAELKKALAYKEDEGKLMYAEAVSQLNEFASEKKRLEKYEKVVDQQKKELKEYEMIVDQQKKELREYEITIEEQKKELKNADLKIRMAGAGTWDKESGGLTS